MGQREANEVEYLTVCHAGQTASIIGQPVHVQGLYDYWVRRNINGRPNAPVQVNGDLMVEFTTPAQVAFAQHGLDEWREWYSSDARQLICRFDQLRAAFDEVHSPKKGILRISRSTLEDFRKCEPKHWEAENWGSVDERFTDPMQHGSVDVLKSSLLNILSTQGIAEIEIVHTGDMTIVPVPEQQ